MLLQVLTLLQLSGSKSEGDVGMLSDLGLCLSGAGTGAVGRLGAGQELDAQPWPPACCKAPAFINCLSVHRKLK